MTIQPIFDHDDDLQFDREPVKRECDLENERSTSPEALRHLRWTSHFAEAEIPFRFKNAKMDDLSGELLDRARDFIERYPTIDSLKNPGGIFLTGNTGSGKTHALIAVMKELITQGRRGRFCDVTELFQTLKAGFNKRDFDSPIDRLQNIEILMLDDLGAGHALSAWEHEQIYGLINHRYNQGASTLITSNLKFGADLAACIGERSASRIGQMCEVWSIGAGVEDRRNPKARPAS